MSNLSNVRQNFASKRVTLGKIFISFSGFKNKHKIKVS